MPGRKIILAVDDMPENLMLMGSLLEDYFDVRLAKSAKIALDLLHGTQGTPCVPVDLILLDIEMPGMTGFDFLRMLKEKNGQNKLVPVVFVTSHADADFIEKAANSGAKGYILKPIKDDVLYKKIDNIIGMPKFKINSFEGKIEQLFVASSSGDTANANNLIKELVGLVEKEGIRARTFMQEIEKFILAFEYGKATEKIRELQDYLSTYRAPVV